MSNEQAPYVLGILKQFKAKSDYENALNEHRKKFKSHVYGLDRRNFVNHDLAMEHHLANFDYSSVPRHHYDDTPEGQAEYDKALMDAKQEHAQQFDPGEWAHTDNMLKPEYFQALKQAHDDHDSKFQYTPPQPDTGGDSL